MAEDSRTVRAVDWKGLFPVLHLLRAFRMAIHPSKLLLGLALILLVYTVGRSMDGVWVSKYKYPHVPQFMMELPSAGFMGVDPAADSSGPFDVLLKWELTCLHHMSQAVLSLNPELFIYSLRGFVADGPGWAFRNHPLFASAFSLVLLLAWAIFGGAIARIAAVHVARDEKISTPAALRFSSGKVLSFIFAPVILALFIGFLGLVIALSGLVYYIPWLGPIAIGAAFIFIICVGFVMALAVFGAVGGSGLMYPTIAVEGSDSFDAVSRSFSYFFARPLRLLGYSLLAIVYGVVTYLIIKLFLLAMFWMIQNFQMWMLSDVRAKSYREFFPGPQSADALSYDLDFAKMKTWPEKIGSGMLHFWYYLVVGVLGAYAISYYFSACTIIYCLLRQDVDNTEMDDVYLEESDDELSENVTVPEPAPGLESPALAKVEPSGVLPPPTI